MSKSKKNYREPGEIFDTLGADAMRWYFLANQPPWTSIRFSQQAIKESVSEFLLRLWNVYSFFVIYAGIDGFDPAAEISGAVASLDAAALSRAKSYRPPEERGELDRWILSEMHRMVAHVIERMDAYDNYSAARRIGEFVDALSNWYVRRSRDRFWSGQRTAEKIDAYWTLYECLLTLLRTAAPLVPFVTEALWRNLAVAAFGPKRTHESVHLCDFPAVDRERIDETLSSQMALMREIVSLGRAARMSAKLKVRQPLARVEIVLVRPEHKSWLAEHAELVRDELNVKSVEFVERADQYVSYTVLPDLKRLGPRLGKRLPALKEALSAANPAALLAQLDAAGQVELELADGAVALDREDIQVRLQAQPGWTAAQGPSGVVILSTEIDDALRADGWVRELVHAVQSRRKEIGCQYTDRVTLAIDTAHEPLRAAVLAQADFIRRETLASELRLGGLDASGSEALELDGHWVSLTVAVAR